MKVVDVLICWVVGLGGTAVTIVVDDIVGRKGAAVIVEVLAMLSSGGSIDDVRDNTDCKSVQMIAPAPPSSCIIPEQEIPSI